MLGRITGFLRRKASKARGRVNYYLVKWGLFGYGEKWNRVNLCGGGLVIPGFADVDLYPTAEINVDLEKKLLPFADNSIETLVCISAINYFDKDRGREIVRDVHRVLKYGGKARFGTQNLRVIIEKYLVRDEDFFGKFPGQTLGEKVNNWFYGYKTIGGKSCKYVYDFDTLYLLFKEAGFTKIEEKKYMESDIAGIERIDNRPEQMFFLEATK